MPQVGWRDPATGKEDSFDWWLREADQYGSAMDLPYEVLEGIRQQLDKSDRPDGITVTQLNGCARAVALENMLDYYTAPLDNYPAFRGTLAHGLIEKFKPHGAVIEQRYYRQYKGIEISGQVDSWRITGTDDDAFWTREYDNYLTEVAVYEKGDRHTMPEHPGLPKTARLLIRDWKTKDDLPTGTYLAHRYQQQGNLYAWLLRWTDRSSLDIEFVFISMSGVRVMELFNGGTFRNGRAKPEQMWGQKELERFLDDRLLTLAAVKRAGRPLPYDQVPTDDLWQCGWCSARDLCHRLAAEEAEAAFAAGKKYDRLPPRNRDVESGRKK